MNDPTLEAKETDDSGSDELLGMPKTATPLFFLFLMK